MAQTPPVTPRQPGFLGWIEYNGNRLPDPVFIFFWLILFVVAISVVAALAGLSAVHPTQFEVDGSPLIIEAASLLSADNIQRLLVEMPTTFTVSYTHLTLPTIYSV